MHTDSPTTMPTDGVASRCQEEIPAATDGDRFISWAQNCEDVMLWRALRDVSDGFFIDLGAGEPEAESVTWAFYLRGWQGINLEPVKDTWQRLCKKRPRDININAAIGASDGQVSLYLVDGGNGLSTTNPSIAAGHEREGLSVQMVTCPVMSLTRLCELHVRGPIHFLKVDVEGSERDALLGADFERYRPWILVVEATLPNTTIPSYEQWERLLLAFSYRFAYFDGLNRYYVANENWDDLGKVFTTPPNVFDRFVRASEVAAEHAAAESLRQCEHTDQEALTLRRDFEALTHQRETMETQLECVQQQLSALLQQQEASEAELQRARGQVEALTLEQETLKTELQSARAQLEMVTQQQTTLEIELRRAEEERGIAEEERRIFEQEMFEVNRHAAWVARERQDLLWRTGEMQAQLGELAQWRDYVLASTSWHVTRPLRAARSLYSRVRGR